LGLYYTSYQCKFQPWKVAFQGTTMNKSPMLTPCCLIGCRLFCLIEYIASIVLTIKERDLQDFWLKHCIGDDDLLARKTSSEIVRYISISAISMI
jgi:hypothetical protein